MLTTDEDLRVGLQAGLFTPPTTTLVREFFKRVPQPITTLASPALMPQQVHILDVSFWHDYVDFKKAWANGARGVIIRLGQGIWVDTQLENHYLRATDIGMPVGFYWYFDSRYEPRRQADITSELVSRHPYQLGLWGDFEETYGGKWAGWSPFSSYLQNIIYNFPSFDPDLGVYSGYYYWLTYGPTSPIALEWFARFKLWEAWYTKNFGVVKIPQPWTEIELWQDTGNADGHAYGSINAGIDHNFHRLTTTQYNLKYLEVPVDINTQLDMIQANAEDTLKQVASIRDEISINPPPPPPPPIPVDEYLYCTADRGLYIRNAPNGTTIGSLAYKAKVKVLERKSVNGVSWVRHGGDVSLSSPVAGWSSEEWLTDNPEGL